MSQDDGPFCPECNEPVSPTSSYCMHCYADLPWAEDGADAHSSGGTTGERSRSPAATGEQAGGPAAESGTAVEYGDSPSVNESVADVGSDGAAVGEGGVTDHVPDGPLLDPEGLADNVLTILVAIVGSLVIGFVGFMVLVILTESAWAVPVGILAWLFGLAYLARQYSVQETVAKTFYGVAVVLLTLPLVTLSPGIDESLADRATLFGAMLISVAIPAGISAAIGYALLWFAPEEA